MNNVNTRKLIKITWPTIFYLLLIISAVIYDRLTDRALGALILSILPISLILLILLVAGQNVKTTKRHLVIRDLFLGAALILTITIIFCSLGATQTKTGELIFTYAMLISCMPISMVLPFLVEPLGLWFIDKPLTRIILTWLICIGLGWTEWRILSWFFVLFRRKPSG
jgi:hypothetical protein